MKRWLPRAAYRDISLYAPDRAPCTVDLSDNTNLWGMPPSTARVIRELVDGRAPAVTRYPSLYAPELKRALASYAGVRVDEVVTGCGSDDVLDSAMRAFAEPGARVAFPEPSFAMLPLFAKMNGLRGVSVPLAPGLDIDPEALLSTNAAIIYVCSPNNPTGTKASREALEHLLAHAPGIVILDEAYAEFSDESWIAEAPGRERLLVVRTMSKAFGLAGLRVGYAVGRSELVAEVEKSRGPYKVSALAERAAVTALTEDQGWVRERIADAVAIRQRLTDTLAGHAALAEAYEPLPSFANFVLLRVADSGLPGAAVLARAMRERGVAVRPFSALLGIGDALRVTIGPWGMMQTCLAELPSRRAAESRA